MGYSGFALVDSTYKALQMFIDYSLAAIHHLTVVPTSRTFCSKVSISFHPLSTRQKQGKLHDVIHNINNVKHFAVFKIADPTCTKLI